MRRSDREVTDFRTILAVIDRCDILRIGLADGEFPYIVPVNFAYTVSGSRLTFYIHGAMAGRKYDLMRKNRRCSFEMDIPLGLEVMQQGVTTHYQSVMGTADIDFPEGPEKEEALKILLRRYPETRGFVCGPDCLPPAAAAKLTVREISAKINPLRER